MADTSNPNSYVDTYTPPSSQPPVTTTPAPSPAAPLQDAQLGATPMPPVPPAPPAPDQPSMPTAAPSMPPTAPVTPGVPSQSQTLEDQNIFELLGVQDVSDDEKEQFLDELQQVIWEDFLENDVNLLITESEKTELNAISAKTYQSDLDKQEAIVVYLEKLIPDLEEIMLEKALELKQDMVEERVASLKELYAGQADKLQVIAQAESQMSNDQWRDAATTLNSLK